MKKYLFLVLALFMVTGCVRVNDASIDRLVETTINSKYDLYNHVNKGYKYYLPRTLKAIVTDEYNEVIKSKYYDYYLYVDLVAYNSKKISDYVADENIYYSKVISKDDLKGIINIVNQDDLYKVNIKYNYAKIEVVCKYEDLNEVITNSMVILSSINYVDDVIVNLLSENEFTATEEQINIFDKNNGDSNLLDEVDDIYKGNEEDDYDPDVIKERR